MKKTLTTKGFSLSLSLVFLLPCCWPAKAHYLSLSLRYKGGRKKASSFFFFSFPDLKPLPLLSSTTSGKRHQSVRFWARPTKEHCGFTNRTLYLTSERRQRYNNEPWRKEEGPEPRASERATSASCTVHSFVLRGSSWIPFHLTRVKYSTMVTGIPVIPICYKDWFHQIVGPHRLVPTGCGQIVTSISRCWSTLLVDLDEP